MKYNIQINQRALIENGSQLDLIDCAILDYLYFLCSSPSPAVIKNRLVDNLGVWTWVDYSHLLDQMPLLRIKTKGALTPRFARIEKEGWLTFKRSDHQKLYALLNPKIDKLFSFVNSSIHENEQLPRQSYSRKRTDNTITNTIKNKSGFKKPNGDNSVDNSSLRVNSSKMQPASETVLNRTEEIKQKIRARLPKDAELPAYLQPAKP